MKPDLLVRVRAALACPEVAALLACLGADLAVEGLVEEIDEALAAIDPDTGLQVADLVACCSDNDRLLDKAQEECTKLRADLAEMERPLDAQMARLNAALIAANEENLRLSLALSEADDVAAAALAALAQRVDQVTTVQQERDALLEQINSPVTEEFILGTRNEIVHQVHRYGTVHDRAKEPQEWYFLLGYLAGKILRAQIDGDREKALHHTISSAAMLGNWHTHIKLGSQPGAPGHSDLQRFLLETFGEVPQ